MRILLTNDDGIHAPGLRAMRKELMQLGEVVVVAPAGEQSAVGHSVTLLTPLIIQEIFEGKEFIGWAVEGRPADCVKLALLELMPEPPDFVVSGMNAGSNAGINVLYSGTVAAAIEAAFYRQTSFAVSLQYTKPPRMNFEQAAGHARKVVSQILAQSPPKGTLFNINIPSTESSPVKGIRVVPQNVSSYQDSFDRRVDPRGRTYFWSGNEINCPEPHPDSDVTAMDEGYITVTPLQFDLTNAEMLRRMREWEFILGG